MGIASLLGSGTVLVCITVHGDVRPATPIARAAKHADAVEIHGDVPAAVYGDHAPFAAGAAQLLDDRAHGLRQRQLPVLHQRADVIGDDLADEEFALSRAPDRARRLIRVG